MSSNRMVTRCFAAAFVAAFVMVAALGCGSDEGNAPTEAAPANATTEAATGNADTGTGTGGAIESLQEAQAQLCSEVSDLEADLTEVSTSGTEAGQDVLERLGSGAAALEAGAATLRTAGADDAATAAEDLASRLQSLSTSGGEDAQGAGRRGGRRGAAAHGRSAVSVTAPQPRAGAPAPEGALPEAPFHAIGMRRIGGPTPILRSTISHRQFALGPDAAR